MIDQIASILIRCFRNGNKLLIAGNGGSAADAQHIAAEFVGRYRFDRAPLPALALASDVATLTAIGNDYGFEKVFSRPVEALGKPGDVLLAISTSGRSENILHALMAAKRLGAGMVTIGFTGLGSSPMRGWCDHCLVIPESDPALVQERYMAAAHKICEYVERDMFTPCLS